MRLYLISILAFFIVLAGCHTDTTIGRFIDPNDTQYSKNIRKISAEINEDQGNAKLYYERGLIFYHQTRYKDAVWDFETATHIDSNNAVYLFRLSEAMLQLDTVASLKIIKNLRKAIRIQPKFPEAELALSKLLVARQEYQEAESLLKALLSREVSMDEPYVLMAISRKEQKDTTGAISWLEKGLSYNPDNIDAVLQLASLYRNKDRKMAVAYYNRALKTNELNYEALYEKSLLMQEEGKYKDALQGYDRVIQINPGHRLAYYNAAFIYAIFKEYNQAMEKLNKVLDQDGTFARAYALRGEIYALIGNKKAALQDYKTALEIEPNNQMASTGLDALK